MDRKTRKILTMLGALHLRVDFDRVYMSLHNGERGIASVEMCARTEENNLAFYVKMSSGQFLGGVMISNILVCEESKEKNIFQTEIQNKNIA